MFEKILIFIAPILTIAVSMDAQAKIRDVLVANNIDYVIKTKNLQASPWHSDNRERTGTAVINTNYSYEYKIYVHKKDYEKAVHLIRNR